MEAVETADSKAGKMSRVLIQPIWRLPFYALILTLVMGVMRSVGILYVALIDAEQFTRQQASWPGSVGGAVTILFGPLVGMLSARWSPHQMVLCGVFLYAIGFGACFFSTNLYVLIIFYGVARSCGMSFVMLTIPVVINTVFKENRALAMGISGSGKSFGGFLWPYVLQFLLNKYDLNGTFLLVSGICLNGLIPAVGFLGFNIQRYRRKNLTDERAPILSGQKPNSYSSYTTSQTITKNNGISETDIRSKQNTSPLKPEFGKFKHANVKEKPRYFNVRIIKNIFTCRGFYVITVSRIVTSFYTVTYVATHIDYLGDKGIPAPSALHMIVVFSAGDLFGRLGLTWITDKKYLSRQFFTAAVFTVSGSVILLFTFANGFSALLCFAFILGVCQGSSMSINSVMVADYMRKDELALALAFTRSVNGAISIGRAPVIGYFRDVLGTYDYLYRIISGSLIFASLMWIVEGIIVLKKNKYTKLEDKSLERKERRNT